MIDFHTHILPDMDDGSESPEMSIQMLNLLKEQGVTTVCLTSHFYPAENDPDTFIERRRNRFRQLIAALGGMESLPISLRLGAEVLYYTGISGDPENLRKLCLQGTDWLLLEMPFHSWNQGMIDEVLALQEMAGIRVMLSHVDRYLAYVPMGVFDDFRNRGIVLTMNTSALIDRRSRRKALNMIREWKIGYLTSDCHDLKDRAPAFDKAFSVLEKNKLVQQLEMFKLSSL